MTRGTTVMASRYVRIYETSGTKYYFSFSACSVWSRQPIYLFEDDTPSKQRLPFTSVASRFVASIEGECIGGDHGSGQSCDASIVVRDVKRGTRRRYDLATDTRDGTPAYVTNMIVTARGWVAWEQRSKVVAGYEVWAMSPTGVVSKLFTSQWIPIDDPAEDSLAVNGDRLYWQFGDTPGSALLREPPAAAAASASSTRAVKPTAKGCATRGETIVANRYVRVFRSPGASYDDDYSFCSVWSRKGVYMFDTDRSPDDSLPLLAIGGRYIAFEEGSCYGGDHGSYDGCDANIVVYDAKQRRSWRAPLPNATRDTRPGIVLSMVVTARGWVAWEGYRSSYSTLEVWAMPPRGTPRKITEGLAEGDIVGEANRTLAVNGDRLYWQFGDTPGSALLR